MPDAINPNVSAPNVSAPNVSAPNVSAPAESAPPWSIVEPADPRPLAERLRDAPGLAPLVAETEATWRARAEASGEGADGRPGWRTFEDAFPTFYEFTNRPR